jgi:hypothetical protein
LSLQFYWDRKSQRYRYQDTKRFVSEKAVASITSRVAAIIEVDLLAVGTLLSEGKVGIGAWYEATREGLKKLHSYNYMLGAGGVKNMDSRDYGRLGAIVKEQDKHLRAFAKDIVEGRVSLKQFRKRLEMYLSAAHGTQEKAREAHHKQAGYLWERRHRTKSDSCQPCIFYEKQGWQKIGTLPSPGAFCDCLANCGCYKVFSNKPHRPADGLSSWGWTRGILNGY